MSPPLGAPLMRSANEEISRISAMRRRAMRA